MWEAVLLECTAKAVRALWGGAKEGRRVEVARRSEAVRTTHRKRPRVRAMGMVSPHLSLRKQSSWNMAAMVLSRQSCSTERRVSLSVGA